MIVDPFDVASMEAGLERATRPEEAARLIAQGRERARTFRWQAAARATVDVYRKVLS